VALSKGQAYYDSKGQAINYRAGIEKDMKKW
jgi:hypothetical protein